jgi:hypothetical protein
MEVHAHTHTERKRFKHYLWEFLMLFLAVFCGFLAENFREQRVEKHRGKQYILSLYEDLKSDTLRLKDMILFDDEKIVNLNDIGNCFDTVLINPSSSECVRKLIFYSRFNRIYAKTDRTTAQLASAGGFRILDKDDADSILSYLNMVTEYEYFQNTGLQSAQENVRNTLNEVGNFKVVKPFLQLPGTNRGLTKSAFTADLVLQGPLLSSNDKGLLNKWFNQLLVYQRVTKAQHFQLIELLGKVTGLINYFKKKYNLE